MTPPRQPLQRLMAGGIAGAVSRTVVAPFERLRTVMMTDSSATFSGALQGIWRDGGVFGLFKGNGLTVLKSMPQSAIQLTVYDSMREVLLSLHSTRQSQGKDCREPKKGKEPRLSQAEKALSGVSAGVAACLATFPLETMRTCRSLSGAKGGLRSLCQTIYAQGGLKTFYRGLNVGLLEEGITAGLSFWAYELGQQMFASAKGRAPTSSEKGFIGGATACFNMVFTVPLILVQRRLQVQGIWGNPVRYKNGLDCFQQIVAEHGVRGLYRGFSSSLLKVAPSIGVMYFLYAKVIQQYGIGGVRVYPHAPADGQLEEDAAAEASK